MNNFTIKKISRQTSDRPVSGRPRMQVRSWKGGIMYRGIKRVYIIPYAPTNHQKRKNDSDRG